MKQELLIAESKSSILTKASVSSSHGRVPRTREVPRMVEPSNGSSTTLKARLKPSPSDPNRSRSVPSVRKTRTEDEVLGVSKIATLEEPKPFSRSTHHRASKEMQQRLEISESLVDKLQSELTLMIAQFEKLQCRNSLLESQNKQLLQKLSAAEAKILVYEKQEQQVVQETNKAKLLKSKNEDFAGEGRSTQLASVNPKSQPLAASPAKVSAVSRPPPPPPPPLPPPRRASEEVKPMSKPTALVELYHSLTKQNSNKGPLGNPSPIGGSNPHNNIVGEIQNRSAHLLAIKADVENKGDFIRTLIEKVKDAAYTDIGEVIKFVDWLDKELSTLADERAVLKHFNWPERKADSLREAAFEYRDLKKLELEVSSFEDDVATPCEACLKKIVTLQEKCERAVERVIKLRETAMVTYRECNIPTQWILDSGMVSKIKLSCVKLVKVYIRRVSAELRVARHAEKESAQQALLVQGVRFAYRAYQFAGGLDSETMCAVEELRKRVQAQEKSMESSGLLVPN